MSSASRSDLVRHIQGSLDCTRAEARASLEAVLEGIQHFLIDGQKVAFSGFGTFQPYERGPLRRYDMNRGKTRTLKARMRIKFTPSPKLLDCLEDDDG